MKQEFRKGTSKALATAPATVAATNLHNLLARAKALTAKTQAQNSVAAATTTPAPARNPYWSQRAAVASPSRKPGELHHRVLSRTGSK